jgi:hypothetical protein
MKNWPSELSFADHDAAQVRFRQGGADLGPVSRETARRPWLIRARELLASHDYLQYRLREKVLGVLESSTTEQLADRTGRESGDYDTIVSAAIKKVREHVTYERC